MVNLQRARWNPPMLSTGRGYAGISRPTAFSKCQRPHFCVKITAVGRHFTYPSGAAGTGILTLFNTHNKKASQARYSLTRFADSMLRGIQSCDCVTILNLSILPRWRKSSILVINILRNNK